MHIFGKPFARQRLNTRDDARTLLIGNLGATEYVGPEQAARSQPENLAIHFGGAPLTGRTCGLATAHLLTDDTVVRPLLPVDGSIAVRRPVVSPAALERTQAPDDVAQRWRARLDRLADVLDVPADERAAW